jgi:hypothetical protein
MTTQTEIFEDTWASDDANALRIAVETAEASGASASPVVTVQWNGRTSYAVKIASTKGPIAAPIVQGVRREIAPGWVVSGGPRLPTPLEWMDRLAEDRQVVLLEALETTPAGRRFKARLVAAREIDPKNPDVARGVAMLRAAGVLTAAEARTLTE